MTVGEFIATATTLLKKAGISTARLDCLVLVSDELIKEKSWILAHLEQALTKSQLDSLVKKIKQRVQHEPLAYIRGKTEFYGRTYIINGHTLEPRPESETLVELALNVVKSGKWKMESGRTDHRKQKAESRKIMAVDVGTGSGAIGITVKLAMPELTVIGTDISDQCINIATKNAQKLNSDVKLYKGNLLEPILNDKQQNINGTCIILANLPYVPEHYQLNKAAEFEPRVAIFGGKDGLDLYREMFTQIKNGPLKPSYVLTESLPFQHDELAKIAAGANYQLEQSDDFIQVFTNR